MVRRVSRGGAIRVCGQGGWVGLGGRVGGSCQTGANEGVVKRGEDENLIRRPRCAPGAEPLARRPQSAHELLEHDNATPQSVHIIVAQVDEPGAGEGEETRDGCNADDLLRLVVVGSAGQAACVRMIKSFLTLLGGEGFVSTIQHASAGVIWIGRLLGLLAECLVPRHKRCPRSPHRSSGRPASRRGIAPRRGTGSAEAQGSPRPQGAGTWQGCVTGR